MGGLIRKGKWESREERDFTDHIQTVKYCSCCGHEAFWVSNAPDFLEHDDPYMLFDSALTADQI